MIVESLQWCVISGWFLAVLFGRIAYDAPPVSLKLVLYVWRMISPVLTVRPETPGDIDSIRCVNEQAFGQRKKRNGEIPA